LQRGVFRLLVDLQAAINRYLGEHNRKPTPFVWTADPDRIIEKVEGGYQAMASNTGQLRRAGRRRRELPARAAYIFGV